jgi:(p)ppGpp synthase/HD superfamily hydrolase
MTRAAFGFAAARHAGQYRDVDGVPFIVHLIEVGRLLHGDGQPENVVAAGLLHDVLEKTATPPLELELVFGTDVVQLVAAVSERLPGSSWNFGDDPRGFDGHTVTG